MDETGGTQLPDERLAVPAYHRSLREHLERTEPELWRWFGEASHPSPEEIEQAELQLLKTCYRLDGDVHSALAGIAQVIAGKLGLDTEIVLYQELHTDERNARVTRLGERIHVVFTGDLLDLLDVAEQEAVLAHELAHTALLDTDDRAFWTLDHMVHRMDSDAAASDALGETARRLRLHTEVYADAIALEVTEDLRSVVSAMVKISTGLRNVDPDAYLRQARQIVEADDQASHGWTHPELHVRIACLAARQSDLGGAIVERLIDGPDDLDHIDLLGQLRLQSLVARILAAGLDIAGDDAPDVHAYLRNYPELDVGGDAEARPEPLGTDELAQQAPSVRHLAGALLTDMALAQAGPEAGLHGLQSYAKEAARIGVADEFDKILARATKQSVAAARALRSPT